jgi:hypothetical protein
VGRCPAHTLPPALSGSCVTARQPVAAAVLQRRRRVATGACGDAREQNHALIHDGGLDQDRRHKACGRSHGR